MVLFFNKCYILRTIKIIFHIFHLAVLLWYSNADILFLPKKMRIFSSYTRGLLIRQAAISFYHLRVKSFSPLQKKKKKKKRLQLMIACTINSRLRSKENLPTTNDEPIITLGSRKDLKRRNKSRDYLFVFIRSWRCYKCGFHVL